MTMSTRATKKDEADYRTYTAKAAEQAEAKPAQKKAKPKFPCPEHPDIELNVTTAPGYVFGVDNAKKKEVNGVGFCALCNCFRAFTYEK